MVVSGVIALFLCHEVVCGVNFNLALVPLSPNLIGFLFQFGKCIFPFAIRTQRIVSVLPVKGIVKVNNVNLHNRIGLRVYAGKSSVSDTFLHGCRARSALRRISL